MLPTADHAIDGRGRAAHHHQLGPVDRKSIVHGDFGAGDAPLLRQRNHLRFIDKAGDLCTLVPHQIDINSVGDEGRIGDNGAAHLDQTLDVRQSRWAEINALGQRSVIGLALYIRKYGG